MVYENSGNAYYVETLEELELSLGHLQAELARIDILIRRAVRRWQLAGQDSADTFRGLYVSDAEAAHLLQRPFGSNWGQIILLSDYYFLSWNNITYHTYTLPGVVKPRMA